jgi:phage-related protein
VKETLKPIEWMGDSLERVRSFSKFARQHVGFELEMIQRGLDPSDWKPMPTIGSGVNEIRIHSDVEHRVFYVAKFRRSIYVLHAFTKKTQKPPPAAIRLAKARYREILQLEAPKR